VDRLVDRSGVSRQKAEQVFNAIFHGSVAKIILEAK
jgi:hypothetical protein